MINVYAPNFRKLTLFERRKNRYENPAWIIQNFDIWYSRNRNALKKQLASKTKKKKPPKKQTHKQLERRHVDVCFRREHNKVGCRWWVFIYAACCPFCAFLCSCPPLLFTTTLGQLSTTIGDEPRRSSRILHVVVPKIQLKNVECLLIGL